MLVGEIGIDRDTFLYRLQYWEIVLITRGYFKRYHPMYDAARLVAHQTHYCMGVPKGQTPKTPQEWLPFSWEKEHCEQSDLPTDDEIAEMLAEMAAINAQNTKQTNI